VLWFRRLLVVRLVSCFFCNPDTMYGGYEDVLLYSNNE
jgi:hypothetical protein